MTTPTPPVSLTNQCSIIHNNTLYVYSPDAFLTLSLQEGAQWEEKTNGVPVEGARCVYGGIDGANNQSALYIVGGVPTDSNTNYTGLQRYSMLENSWTTITPLVQVTQNRQFHGAAYINSSSGILIYGGSQQGLTGLSSETFFVELYAPFRVQAYTSWAPPVKNPFMMPWTDDRVLMVGGSSTNLGVFTFGAADGWQDLGLTLPHALPNSSVAQAALLNLDDGSKILQTFDLGEHPVSISSNVLLNPGGSPATDGEVEGVSTTTTTTGSATTTTTGSATTTTTTGSATTTTTTSSTTTGSVPTATKSAKARRDLSLSNFPIYNGTNSPSKVRTNFSLAQSEDGLLAFVGGDANNTISFFDQRQDGWVLAEAILGSQTATSSTTSTSTATATPTQSGASSARHRSRHLGAILGGVFGSIFGLLAIALLILFCIRIARRKKTDRERNQSGAAPYSDDKAGGQLEPDEGLQSLSANSQPMGLSPVQSAIISQAHTSALFVQNPSELVRPESNASARGKMTESPKPTTTAHRLFHRDKGGALEISKPMNPDLGDYALRQSPNIELGHATPAEPLNSTALFSVVAASNLPSRNKSHRRTNEAWAKYFNNDPDQPTPAEPARSEIAAAAAVAAAASNSTPRPVLRDSNGRPLEINSVTANSPVLESGSSDERTRTFTAHISIADSMDDYEDELIDETLSSGVPSVNPQQRWTPLQHGWSHPDQDATALVPTRTDTSSSDNTSESKLSAIPNFPMPSSATRNVRASLRHQAASNLPPTTSSTYVSNPVSRSNQPRQTSEASIYSSYGLAHADDSRPRRQPPDDLSWLNLGAQDAPRNG